MPIKAMELVETLHDNYGQVCLMKDVMEKAQELAFDRDEVDALMRVFNDLGMLLYFPHVGDLVILEPQWLIDSMACLIREHEGHHRKLDR